MTRRRSSTSSRARRSSLPLRSCSRGSTRVVGRTWDGILSVLATVTSVVLLAGAADAQASARPARIGVLLPGVSGENQESITAFRQGLSDLGHVEGQTFVLEPRWAAGKPERYPELVADLLRLPVDVILVVSTAALPALRQTTAVPVVAATMGDPVAAGWAQSIARPGGHITGLTFTSDELLAKRVQLLKEAVPGSRRIALLWHPRPDTARPPVYAAAAASVGVELQVFEARSPADFDSAFEAMARRGSQALVLANSPLFREQRRRLAALALKQRLPAISGDAEFAEAGLLLQHGASVLGNFRRAAVYVDKILKGARPGDLPIELPSRITLVVNLKTAKALGLTIPPAVLARADEIIQ
jgi:putative ABC transport system substrate-binding protein